MQYKYTDIDQQPVPVRSKLHTIINGVNLDTKIKGFQTLKVSGRELVGRDIESRNYKSMRAGKRTQTSRNYRQKLATNVLISSTLTSRPLEIIYKLEADTPERFREAFEYLNYYINQEEVPIIFTDDPEFYYTGTLTQVETPEPGSNHIVSSFQFECMDAFKYATIPQTWEFEHSGKFMQMSLYPVILEKIEIKALTNATTIIITNKNTGQFIRVDGSLNSGDHFTIDFTNAEIRLFNGQDITSSLYLLSDFEDFSVEYGETLETNINAAVKMTYRQRRL